MARPPCIIEDCGRPNAAHGYCLMHYKRIQRHGTPEYRWGGKVIGRLCRYCERPARTREMCNRHYTMWRLHGDPLYADERKRGHLRPGVELRRGYIAVTPLASITFPAPPSDATVEKRDRAHAVTLAAVGARPGRRRKDRQYEHRMVAGAAPGQIVHHIDGDPLNNDPANLFLCTGAAEHGFVHRSFDLVVYRLYELDVVTFDRERGCYRLDEQRVAACLSKSPLTQ